VPRSRRACCRALAGSCLDPAVLAAPMRFTAGPASGHLSLRGGGVVFLYPVYLYLN
jgi:hypothetical protein